MAEKIVMPKAGMAMEKGTIISWLKDIGDKIDYGEPILEIETDKTTMQVEAMNDGYLLNKLYEAGDEVPVVTTIGYIGEKGEEPPKEGAEVVSVVKTEKKAEPKEETPVKKEVGSQKGNGKVAATPLARRLAKEQGIPLGDIPFSGKAIYADDVLALDKKEVKATPLAKRIAQIEGIDLSGVSGSGYGGKIRKEDLAAKGMPQASQEQGVEQLIPMGGMRKTIAKRMLQSHTEIPPVTLHAEADVTKLAELRQQMNAGGTRKISFNDLVVKACAVALVEFPNINVSYSEQGLIQKSDINIGIAVALEDGLIVPVVKNANRYSMDELSIVSKDMAARAREGKLLPDEYNGGTFTVSNLGMFGITAFTPIINLPEACILGVCAISERLKIGQTGELEQHKIMGLSLTFDHRCVDGAGGAKFLQKISQLLENPIELLM